MGKLGASVVAVVSDILGAAGVPGGSTLGRIFEAIQERRAVNARDIFLEELSAGEVSFEEGEFEPLFEALYLYRVASEKGAANRNLRLLAQVIVGLKRNKALQVDKFQRWVPILSELTRDEVVLLGFSYQVLPTLEGASDRMQQASRFSNRLTSLMLEAGYERGEIEGLCASVGRFGFMIPQTAQGPQYRPSPWIRELGDLVGGRFDPE